MASDAYLLLFFSRRAHLADVLLDREMVLGRFTGSEDADIALPSLALQKQHGTLFPMPDRVCFRETGTGQETFIQPGKRLRFPSDSRHPELVMLVLPADCTYTWNSIPLVRKQRFDLPGSEEISFIRKNQTWQFMRGAEDPVPLSEGTLLRVHGTIVYFTGEQLICGTPLAYEIPDPAADLVIDIRERTISDPAGTRTILKDIHTTVRDGSMVMILGASGAGKTTFLHAVMGYEQSAGTAVYHGKDLARDKDSLRSQIGYVPQKDLLRDAMSVNETVSLAVQMKAPDADPVRRTEEVLKLFGLEKEKDTLVRALSGGQRKRLSCAVEFAGHPSLFFLDEPDTGLDAVMSTGLLRHLRAIADLGTIVFVITHTPDRCRELFDQVIVLARSESDGAGHLAFSGTPGEALRFFGTSSLDEIVTRISRREDGGAGMADHYIRAFAQRRKQL